RRAEARPIAMAGTRGGGGPRPALWGIGRVSTRLPFARARDRGIRAPVRRNFRAADGAMDRRPRPVRRPRDMPVLHRIEVHVIDVPTIVLLVEDQPLPEPALPDSA